MTNEPEIKKRRVYDPKKINKLYQSIANHLTSEEQEIVKEIVADFNNLVAYARDKKKYIEIKENEWLDEMNKNHKMELENRQLKEKIQNQLNTIIRLNKENQKIKETLKK